MPFFGVCLEAVADERGYHELKRTTTEFQSCWRNGMQKHASVYICEGSVWEILKNARPEHTPGTREPIVRTFKYSCKAQGVILQLRVTLELSVHTVGTGYWRG